MELYIKHVYTVRKEVLMIPMSLQCAIVLLCYDHLRHTKNSSKLRREDLTGFYQHHRKI